MTIADASPSGQMSAIATVAETTVGDIFVCHAGCVCIRFLAGQYDLVQDRLCLRVRRETNTEYLIAREIAPEIRATLSRKHRL